MQALEASGYSKASRWKLVQGDVESLNGTVTGTFDVVYCYGLLYHLENPAAALSAMAARCRDLLLLETCVSFGGHDALNPIRLFDARHLRRFSPPARERAACRLLAGTPHALLASRVDFLT